MGPGISDIKGHARTEQGKPLYLSFSPDEQIISRPMAFEEIRAGANRLFRIIGSNECRLLADSIITSWRRLGKLAIPSPFPSPGFRLAPFLAESASARRIRRPCDCQSLSSSSSVRLAFHLSPCYGQKVPKRRETSGRALSEFQLSPGLPLS